MSEYEIYIKISGEDSNSVESIYNQLVKKVDKGNVEFGVGLSVERINAPADIDGFDD